MKPTLIIITLSTLLIAADAVKPVELQREDIVAVANTSREIEKNARARSEAETKKWRTIVQYHEAENEIRQVTAQGETFLKQKHDHLAALRKKLGVPDNWTLDEQKMAFVPPAPPSLKPPDQSTGQ